MKTFELDFKPYSLYKYPVLLIASGWHYIYRIKPFTYDSHEFKKLPNLIRNIFIFVLFIIALNFYYAFF
jgi:hypothetical protein